MDISCTQPSFQAKFIYSDALKQVADYAVKHNKFNKLNQARKNIDSTYLTTRLKLDISKNADNLPVVSFTRYVPKKAHFRRLNPAITYRQRQFLTRLQRK